MKQFARALGLLGCMLALTVVASVLYGQDKEEGKIAKVTVLVPDEDDVALTANGKDTKATGHKHKFETPPLKAGPKYYYLFAAKWQPNNYETYTRTRKVYVKPGESVTVDLTKKDANQPDDIFIRYVPTPSEFVDAMMKLGKVGKDDVVYDLGCGDGRIVITAVSKYGAKSGVGVDLDPDRLKECKENAEKAKLKIPDQVEFRKEDVMKIKDLAKATVVTIYLSDGLNGQLWPILEKECKPGTRIITHRFLMGNKGKETGPPPESSTEVESDEPGFHYKEKVHLWTIGKKAEKDKDKKDKNKDEKKDKDKKDKKDK